MRLLMLHNRYREPGGEDEVFAAERDLMRAGGHQVTEYQETNEAIGPEHRGRAAARAIWSEPARDKVRALLKGSRSQVAHFNNTFFRISPSAYYACREERVAVVQTLHNYRLLCPAATLYRQGAVCEACVGAPLQTPAIAMGCYRDSRLESALVAAVTATHRWLGTWRDAISVYVATTEFARRKFVEGGLPAEKIVVKPNFVHPDPGPRDGGGGYALFVGRLAPEKGLRTLMKAWSSLGEIPLKLAGGGPLAGEVAAWAAERAGGKVEWLGRCERSEIFALMKGARFLVFPSEWYEGFPVTIAEAFACGLPVIVSRLGAMAEIVDDGRTGLHFTAGDSAGLAGTVARAWSQPELMRELGEAARREYETRYSAAQNADQLVKIYERAMAECVP